MTILERIATGSAVIFVAIVITAMWEYAYQVAMAHFLSPNTFGILCVFLSIFWISTVILTSGVRISWRNSLQRIQIRREFQAIY